jgi:hypothetical protein
MNTICMMPGDSICVDGKTWLKAKQAGTVYVDEVRKWVSRPSSAEVYRPTYVQFLDEMFG